VLLEAEKAYLPMAMFDIFTKNEKIKKSKIKNIRVSLNQTIKKYHYENYK